MKNRFLLTVVALSLAACGTATPTTQETTASSSAATETQTAFTGTATAPDYVASSLSFVGKSSIVDHPGVFGAFTFDLATDASAPSDLSKATITVSADVASIRTDSEGLDGHLQKEEFFDAANHPTATFVSSSITQKSGNVYSVTGTMTTKGTSKTLTMDATITDEGFTSSFSFPRKDFGVGNDSYGDKLLSEQVPVTLSVVFK